MKRTNDRNEIKRWVREFYLSHPIVRIDNDDIEPFFLTHNALVAFKFQTSISEFTACPDMCKKIEKEFKALSQTNVIKRILVLILLPINHQMQIEDLSYFKAMQEKTPSVTWGLGVWDKEEVRVATLVLIA